MPMLKVNIKWALWAKLRKVHDDHKKISIEIHRGNGKKRKYVTAKNQLNVEKKQ